MIEQQLSDIIISMIKDLRVTVDRVDNKVDSLSERIQKLDATIRDLAHNDEVMTTRLNALDAKLEGSNKLLHTRIDDLAVSVKINAQRIDEINRTPLMFGNKLIRGIFDKVMLIFIGGAAAYIVLHIIKGFQ